MEWVDGLGWIRFWGVGLTHIPAFGDFEGD